MTATERMKQLTAALTAAIKRELSSRERGRVLMNRDW
jgi:hypothetical protein